MSSLLNWDGSQNANKRREVDEDKDATRPSAQANSNASDSTHGLGAGSGSDDKDENFFNNGTHLQQATVPQGWDAQPVPQTPIPKAPDSAVEADAAAIIGGDDHTQSPTAHVPPRARRLSTQGSSSSESLNQLDVDASTSQQERPHTPPLSQPSPSRTPQGYMEVDEDGEGSPVVPNIPLLNPGATADEYAVVAEMIVDDNVSDLRYPSHDSSENGTAPPDVEMTTSRTPVSNSFATQNAARTSTHRATAAPLLSLNGKPNVLPDSPPSTATFARPASPTLDLFNTPLAGPSTQRSLSPGPPPRKKEPLFLSPTPSDEKEQEQGSVTGSRDSVLSASPVPGFPLFKPGFDYPKPRYTPDDEEVEFVQNQKDGVETDKGKGKEKEKEKEKVGPPKMVKEPSIGGKKILLKPGPPRKVFRRIESSQSQSGSEGDAPSNRDRIIIAKRPKIVGATATAREGRAPANKVKAKAPATKAKAKSKVGPMSKVSSDDAISITDSSDDGDAPARRKPARAHESEEDEDFDAPIQPTRRHEVSKHVPPSETPEVVDSGPQAPESDSDIEVIEGLKPRLPRGYMQRRMEVLMPRMPKELRVVVKQARARKAASASRQSASVAPHVSSSKPRPRPTGKKPATDVSMEDEAGASSPSPQVSSSKKPAVHDKGKAPRPLDNTTEKGLVDDFNAAYAANAHVESDDSDSDDDKLLSVVHKDKARKGRAREQEHSKKPFVALNQIKNLQSIASTSAPPLTAKRPRIGSSTPSASAMPPPTSTSRMLPPASSSRIPPPPLPLPASASAPARRTKAAEFNDPPCDSCAAGGLTECVNAPAPNHRRCKRCHDKSVKCSFRGSRGSAARNRAGSVASSRAGSVAPGHTDSVASNRRKALAAGRAEIAVSARERSVVPGMKGKKRPHDGVESAPKKRKTGWKDEDVIDMDSAKMNTVASLSNGDGLFSEDEDDDGELNYDLPPDSAWIEYGSLEKPVEGSLQNASRARWILKYLDQNQDIGRFWKHVKKPEVSEGVLDVKFGDENDGKDGEGEGGSGGGGDGGASGRGRESGGADGKGKGKQRDDHGRRGDEGKGKGKERADGGKGKQRADGKQSLGVNQQARDASGSAPPLKKDSSPRRKPGLKPKVKSSAPVPPSQLSVHAPTPRHPTPLNAANVDPNDAFQPPVIPLMPATPMAAGLQEAQERLLTAYDQYIGHQSHQTSVILTPTLVPPPSVSHFAYLDSPVQMRESTIMMQQMYPDPELEHPHGFDDLLAADVDKHGQGSFWPGRSPGPHRDLQLEGGSTMSIHEASFAEAFAMPDIAFAPAEGSHAGSAQPDSGQEVSDALKCDGEGSTGSSQAAQSQGRFQTIDPSVLGVIPFVPPNVDEDDFPVKSMLQSSKSSEYESEPELPLVPDQPSDDDFKPSKARYGPPRRLSTRTPKPTLKRKATLPPPPSEGDDFDVAEVPPDPTKQFKNGSRGIQWPKGTEVHRCHQCRRATMRRHVFCQSGKKRRGYACGHAYCEGCLVTRYGDTFRGLTYGGTDDFDCPACREICNCTTCTRKRGEAYVGVKTKDAHARLRGAKSANYEPKSAVSKRKQAVQYDSSASPTPRPSVKRIRLILPDPPQTPPPPEPWVPPKVSYPWPAGVKTELFAPDGLPCGYIWVNDDGHCITTYTRDLIIPGVDADGELYWSEADVQSSSSSSSKDEEEDDSAREESLVPQPPPRPKRVRRERVYAGARPLPPPTVKKLWFPLSRKFKFSLEEKDYFGQQGAYVGEPPPKVKEGPLSQRVLDILENYRFSDEEGEGEGEEVKDDAGYNPAHDEDTTGAAPNLDHVDDEDEDIPELPSPPSSSSLEIVASVSTPSLVPKSASLLAVTSRSHQVHTTSADTAPLLTHQAIPASSSEEENSMLSSLTAYDYDDDGASKQVKDAQGTGKWPNEFNIAPSEFNPALHLPELLHRIGSSTPTPASQCFAGLS